ncbi:MAG: hypothetical protein H3Z52_04870 [archaeon]|nr:hypothetical protein [archaeon]MCP8315876.1 hypothetical protein [archaeon]MCP8320259.1 hypothetical protein [archaeon]
MPFEIVCDNCGASLYSGMDLKYANSILKLYNGMCKKCGELLSLRDFILEIEPIEK